MQKSALKWKYGCKEPGEQTESRRGKVEGRKVKGNLD